MATIVGDSDLVCARCGNRLVRPWERHGATEYVSRQTPDGPRTYHLDCWNRGVREGIQRKRDAGRH